MSAILTFDPDACGSPTECAQALRELGVEVSHRLCARIFALGQKRIQLSLAVIEEALAPGPAQTMLLRREWLALAEPGLEVIAPLLDPDVAEVLQKGDVFQIVSPDEAVIAGSSAPGKPSRSLVPAVLGTSEVVSLRPNLLWDPQRLEKASITLLDGEDEDELLADFRYLFRALTTQGKDPSTLLTHAFARNKPSLNQEAARLIREQLDPKLGSLLEQLFSFNAGEVRKALQTLASEPYETVRGRLLATLIANVWQRSEMRPLVLRSLQPLTHRLSQDREAEQRLLEQLLGGLGELVPTQRAQLTEDVVAWVAHSPGLTQLLLEHLEQTADPDRRAFLTQLLALLPLPPGQAHVVEESLIALFYEQGHLSGMLERLRPPLQRLGPAMLLGLFRDPRRSELSQTAKTWLLRMAEQGEELGSEAVESFARDELVEGSRSGLLALIRTDGLLRDGIVRELRGLDEDRRRTMIHFLLNEAERLEPPDDDAVLELLARLEDELPLRTTYDRLLQESEIGSGAAAKTLWRLGRMLAFAPERAVPFVDVEALLAAPIYGRKTLPHVWSGLASLALWQGCNDEQRGRILEMLLDAPSDPSGIAIEALARFHSLGSAHAPRARLEEVLLERVGDDSNLRRMREALDTWTLVVAQNEPPSRAEQLIVSLCRVLVRRASVANLDLALKSALEGDPEMDGVRRRTAWDKGDRDQAMRILGQLALNPRLEERLTNLLVTRLFSFLEEWLLRIKRGENLYENRTTPLWDVVHELLDKRPGPHVNAQAAELCRLLLDSHEASARRLGLEDREDVLRFVSSAIRADVGREVRLDLPRQLLLLMARLGQRPSDGSEPPVVVYFLRKLKEEKLRDDLASILAPLQMG